MMRTLVILLVLATLAWAEGVDSYTVVRGDTLYSIAKRFGTTAEALMQLNGLAGSGLKAGQVLKLPSAASSDKTTPIAQPTLAYQNYRVVRGDTLYSLSKRFGTTVEALMRINKLTKTALALGQILRVPLNVSPPATPEAPKLIVQAEKPEPPESTALPQLTDDFDPTHPLLGAVIKYLGLPYKYGANSDTAVDCSAFVQKVFAELGVTLPRTSREQYQGLAEAGEKLNQGDLVFFSFGGKQIDHVGVYLGRGVFAHTSSYGSRVVIESLDAPYYQKTYRGAKRPDWSSAQK